MENKEENHIEINIINRTWTIWKTYCGEIKRIKSSGISGRQTGGPCRGSASFVTSGQIGDSTNIEFLQSLGIGNFDVCIVAIGGDFQSSLETTAYLKDLGAKLVVSRAARDVQARFLLRNGADEVVYPEKQLANWTAIRYSSEHIFDYIQLSDDHAIFEISIPENWVGKTVGNIDIRKKYNITIMALKRDGKLEMSITPDTVLDKDVTMLVLGASRDIQKCFHI